MLNRVGDKIHPCLTPMVVMFIGVRANIHLGGQTEFCPNGFSGGGVVAEIFRDPYSVGGGGSSRNFPGSILCGWQNFFT